MGCSAILMRTHIASVHVDANGNATLESPDDEIFSGYIRRIINMILSLQDSTFGRQRDNGNKVQTNKQMNKH